MAEENDYLDLEEDEEGAKPEEEKKGLSEGVIKILTYIGLFLGVILISVAASIIVNKMMGTGTGDINISTGERTPLSPPKSVYQIPEFKLPLDKKEDESMTTIVQVKLALAYKQDDQKTKDEIILRKEELRDKIQYVIAKKKYEDINTANKRERELKKDLIYQINNLMENRIHDIYFDTFVISRVPG